MLQIGAKMGYMTRKFQIQWNRMQWSGKGH